MKTIFFHSLKKYIGCLIYLLIIVLLYNLLREQWTILVNYADSTFIGGFSLICVGGFYVFNYLGAYDIFQAAFAKRLPNGKKMTLYEFSEKRKIERSKTPFTYVPYFVVGCLGVVISSIISLFL